MQKYLQVARVSFNQEFAYRANFVMWRIRNILQILIVFYLWDTIFAVPGRELFGYDRERILTYVFGLLIVRAFVLSAKATDVAGEISRGELNKYLLKPVDYFKFWLTRDMASKGLNLSFAVVETFVLFLILKPPFFIQTQPTLLAGFFLTVLIAIFIYFLLIFIISSVPFWMPELAWGAHFLVTVIIVEFLSGALFPLDILPATVQSVINLTPFPYLIFFPLQVYLGNIETQQLFTGLTISLLWLVGLWYLMNLVWKRGLRAYQAYGG
jgi:ABC-2 type transport system permease protein